MKRRIAALFLAVTLVFLLTACAVNKPEAENHNQSSDNTGENDEGEDNTGDNVTTKDEAMALYEAFLSGEGKVSVYADDFEVKAGNTYSIEDLVRSFIEDDDQTIIGNFEHTGTAYTYTTPDENGIPMLGIKLSYSMGNDTSWDTDRIILIKAVNGELKYVKQEANVYRSEAALYDNGILRSGGSDSAISYVARYETADENGNLKFVCEANICLGLSATIIPDFYLPTDADLSLYPDYTMYLTDDETAAYTLIKLSFEPFDYNNTDQSYYNDYIRNKVQFAFMKNDRYVDADDFFKPYYEGIGIKVLDEEGAEYLEAYLSDNGVWYDTVEATPCVWTPLQ